jgi:DNA-binding GntR family transcriptional regulator
MSLYAKTPNKRLLALVAEGLSEEERFLRFNLSDMGLGKLSQEDHWHLFELARDKQVEQTVQALQHHLQRGVQAITRYLASRPSPSDKPVRARKKAST